MILVVLIWVFAFLVPFSTGSAVLSLMNKVLKTNTEFDIAEIFFSGFLLISLNCGVCSLFIPVGTLFLIGVSVFATIFIIAQYGRMRTFLASFLKILKSNKYEVIIFFLLLLFVLSWVSNKITWGDTGLYHSQAIQWIRKYPVVPGLGNIHGRLAFNSMFFVISALFTFEYKDIVIYPLNGICYFVLLIKLFQLYLAATAKRLAWKQVLYALLMLISLLMLLPMLNSPSPDVICSILIMYVFTYIFEYVGDRKTIGESQFYIIAFAVFTCISFKISSVLLVLVFAFFMREGFFRKGIIIFLAGTAILIPFFIRNYYLSGYLVYPYPSLDIFSVDWKIPIADTFSMKEEIEGWARMSEKFPYPEVMSKNITQWIIPWFRDMNFINKVLVAGNLLSIFTFLVMIIRRDFIFAGIQMFIYVNIAFWLSSAPDPRFLYGFLFTGLALTTGYAIRIVELQSSSGILKIVRPALGALVVIILLRRISVPVNTVITPSYWLIPGYYQTSETKTYKSEFKYRVSIPEGDNCYNAEIPCVPYPLTNVVMRGTDLRDGFRIAIPNK